MIYYHGEKVQFGLRMIAHAGIVEYTTIYGTIVEGIEDPNYRYVRVLIDQEDFLKRFGGSGCSDNIGNPIRLTRLIEVRDTTLESLGMLTEEEMLTHENAVIRDLSCRANKPVVYDPKGGLLACKLVTIAIFVGFVEVLINDTRISTFSLRVMLYLIMIGLMLIVHFLGLAFYKANYE